MSSVVAAYTNSPRIPSIRRISVVRQIGKLRSAYDVDARLEKIYGVFRVFDVWGEMETYLVLATQGMFILGADSNSHRRHHCPCV